MSTLGTHTRQPLLRNAPSHDSNASYGVAQQTVTMPATPPSSQSPQSNAKVKVQLVRALALLCACSLSIGSHYASYILGPLKTRLSREMGTSNTEFSLLIAAFSLNSTWTPLLGAVLVGYLGTTITSIIATGLIFLGQAVLLFGDILESVRLMTFGMFIFGLGVSPLAVVQESIIVRFFKNHGLGLSMALGLVVGKASSFIAARTSYPLSTNYGPRAPFVAATSLAAISFMTNLVYLSVSKWLLRSSNTELEAPELDREARQLQMDNLSEAEALKQVAQKKAVRLRDITKLGDVFWAYIWINVLCGAIWSPFTHLAANIFEKRYELTEDAASNEASYLLAGSVFLYPIVGYIIDRMKSQSFLHKLFITSSTMTALCYLWLCLPAEWTKSPAPAVALFGIGQGFAPLLLVVIVPTLVSSKYVPTTLGAHKSLEQSGSTIFQTFAGLLLDRVKKTAQTGDISSERAAISRLLSVFLFLNACQFVSVLGLWKLDKKRKEQAAEIVHRAQYQPVIEEEEDLEAECHDRSSPRIQRNSLIVSPQKREHVRQESVSLQRRQDSSSLSEQLSSFDAPGHNAAVGAGAGEEEEEPLLVDDDEAIPWHTHAEELTVGEAQTQSEHVRGEVFGVISICLIAFAWVFFIITAFLRLRAKGDRDTTPS